MTTFYRDDVERVQEILNKFPEVKTFNIYTESSSGIGEIVIMEFGVTINEISGTFKITLVGSENW